MTAKDLERVLKKAGWCEIRQTGGHKHFKKDGCSYIITIPQHKGDLKKGTLDGILKTAGLK